MNSKFLFTFLSVLFTNLNAFGALIDLDGIKQIDCCIMPLAPSEIGGIVLHKGPYSCQEQVSPSANTFTHIPLDASTSLNWSGYAVATNLTNPDAKSVTDTYGSWTVPNLLSTPGTSYAAIWSGIDGYSNSTVEQIGSLHIWSNGVQQNFAWFEMYPRGLFQIVGFPVSPGDVIGSDVSYIGKNTFNLVIVNYTENVYFIVPTSYTKHFKAERSSAEWIVEAPSSLSQVLPLADFGTVIFTNCKTTINSVTGPIKSCHWQYDPLTMATSTTPRITKAAPSKLFNAGSSFSIDWYHQ